MNLKEIRRYLLNKYVFKRDVEKILSVSATGPRHILMNREKAYENLKNEYVSIKFSNEEELYEYTDPDGLFVKFNLKSAKEKGISLEQIWYLLVRASNYIKIHVSLDKDTTSGLFHTKQFKEIFNPNYRVLLKYDVQEVFKNEN